MIRVLQELNVNRVNVVANVSCRGLCHQVVRLAVLREKVDQCTCMDQISTEEMELSALRWVVSLVPLKTEASLVNDVSAGF